MSASYQQFLDRDGADLNTGGIVSSFTPPGGWEWWRVRQWSYYQFYGLIPFEWDLGNPTIRFTFSNETVVGLSATEQFEVFAATVPSGNSVDIALTSLGMFVADLTSPPTYKMELENFSAALPNSPSPGDYFLVNLERDGADNSVRTLSAWIKFPLG